MMRVSLLGALLILVLMSAAPADETVLFDFETPADLANWSPLKLEDEKLPGAGEPEPKIELTTEGVTSGKHALKITFAGGRLPTISAPSPLADWTHHRAFHADVTAGRTCMVVFRVLHETSRRGRAYNDGVSRWEKAARLEKGTNTVTAFMPGGKAYAKVVTFDIYMYNPHEGESICVDNIRLSTVRPKAETPFLDGGQRPAGKYKVLGTNLEAADVNELADRLKDKWVKPRDRTVEQAEADFRTGYENIRKTRPRAVLAVLREGQKGCDVSRPEQAFTGWKDAGTACHAPMGLTMGCFGNLGKSARIETTFRHRPCFLRVDLSSIPRGAEILAARLVVVRFPGWPRKDWETKPTLFVAEPCRRPWDEYEVNVFEYATGRFWREYAGLSWEGDDPDCVPVFVAHGPSAGKTGVWDFTHAVRYWRGDGHPNHGFILYGANKYVDYLSVCSREHKDVGKRPVLMVVYEPKP